MNKWINPKFIIPPINLPFIAYVEDYYTFTIERKETIKIPVKKVIFAVLCQNEYITDLFSLYKSNPIVLELNQLLLWRKIPKSPKK